MGLYQLELIPQHIRFAIFEAQNWRCCYCGLRMHAGEPWECEIRYTRLNGFRYRAGNERVRRFLRHSRATIEHLTRRADGGTNYYDNLTGACNWCNSNRQDRGAMEWFEEIQKLVASGEHPFAHLINRGL